jgi:hypothetical protein
MTPSQRKIMGTKFYVALCLASVCSAALGQDASELEKKMLDECRAVAMEINTSHGAGISLKDITPLVTWRAACAERPPTGPGNVTALCEGKLTSTKGGASVFFWQKARRGKLNRGYFVCDGSA